MLSWHQKQIALHQLLVQRRALKMMEIQLEMSIRPESPPEVWKRRDCVREELYLISEQRKEIEELPSKKKRLWSELILKIYLWSIADRFKLDS